MVGDFGVRPPAACEHGDAEFGGGEVARHVRARLGVVQVPPSLAEAIGNVDHARVVLGIVFLQTRFEHALQKPMVLADFFNEAVGQGNVPRAHKMASCGFGVLQIHLPHGCDKVQELLRDGIAPLFRHERGFGHAHATAVFAEKVRVVGERVNREKAQAFR